MGIGGLGKRLLASRWGGGGEVGVADGEEIGVQGGDVVVLDLRLEEWRAVWIGEWGMGEVLFCMLL